MIRYHLTLGAGLPKAKHFKIASPNSTDGILLSVVKFSMKLGDSLVINNSKKKTKRINA